MADDPRTEFRDGMRVTSDHMRHMQDRLANVEEMV